MKGKDRLGDSPGFSDGFWALSPVRVKNNRHTMSGLDFNLKISFSYLGDGRIDFFLLFF